jgi:hypothetical protein
VEASVNHGVVRSGELGLAACLVVALGCATGPKEPALGADGACSAQLAPGTSATANDVLWSFFEQHPLSPP